MHADTEHAQQRAHTKERKQCTSEGPHRQAEAVQKKHHNNEVTETRNEKDDYGDRNAYEDNNIGSNNREMTPSKV